MAFNFPEQIQVPNQFVKELGGVRVYLKREDLLHPEVSGNKFRKLKYNLLEARKQKKEVLLTFGGAYSNHIAATAAAARLHNLGSIGVIRGEELGEDLEKTLRENPSLRFAASCGMKFRFMSRARYREKGLAEVQEELREEFGDFYLLPEGGTNALAVKGCEEILAPADMDFDVICCSVGTGGTIAGIINSAGEGQKILGFPALKGDFLDGEIRKLTRKFNWELILDYHFGGYAKVDPALIGFLNSFKRETGIQLDPIYTGKMMYGLLDLVEKGGFKENTRILAIHTGGLQGIAGMNRILEKRKDPLIEL